MFQLETKRKRREEEEEEEKREEEEEKGQAEQVLRSMVVSKTNPFMESSSAPASRCLV